MHNKIINHIVTFLELQLFVTLFSWPILIWWGIPLSWATPLGNFIFNPFLSVFLLLGSLCIMTELLYIPNTALIWLLEQLTSVWLWCISWGKPTFLMYFPLPSIIYLIAIPICALLVLHLSKTPLLRTILFFCFFIFSAVLFSSFTSKRLNHTLLYGKKNIVLLTYNKLSILYIPETLQVKKSFDSWINYSLLPELAKKTGKASLDCIILPHQNKAMGLWVHTLQEHVPCKKIKYCL